MSQQSVALQSVLVASRLSGHLQPVDQSANGERHFHRRPPLQLFLKRPPITYVARVSQSIAADGTHKISHWRRCSCCASSGTAVTSVSIVSFITDADPATQKTINYVSFFDSFAWRSLHSSASHPPDPLSRLVRCDFVHQRAERCSKNL